jgi:protein-S-isoprenylcysteine O-methyltransferase Ste14
MAWLVHDPVASELIGATVAALLIGEVAGTFAGHRGEGGGRMLRSAGESLLLVRRRSDTARVDDRGTLWIVVIGSRVGILAAAAIGALAPSLRVGADTWWTLGLGLAVALAGAALRVWAIVTLGWFFRREVTIERGQRIVRRGPYRVLRHPSYTGLVLFAGGIGLAFGSWVGAAVAAAAMVAGLLPRIRVEERVLVEAFGAEYADYMRHTARLVPGVW